MGDKLIVGQRDGTITCRSGENNTDIMNSHSDGEVWGLAQKVDGTIITSGDDKKVMMWDPTTRKHLKTCAVSSRKNKSKRGHASTLSRLPESQCSRAVATNDSWLAVAGNDGAVSIRNCSNPNRNATSFGTPPSGLKLWHSYLTANTLPSAPTTTVSTSTELATGVSRARATSIPPTSWLSIGAASPSTSERTAALTSSSSGTSPKSHKTPQAVPTSRTLSGPPPPASSSGRPLVSTPEAPMAPMSTPFAAPTTSRSSPLVTISVS